MKGIKVGHLLHLPCVISLASHDITKGKKKPSLFTYLLILLIMSSDTELILA